MITCHCVSLITYAFQLFRKTACICQLYLFWIGYFVKISNAALMKWKSYWVLKCIIPSKWILGQGFVVSILLCMQWIRWCGKTEESNHVLRTWSWSKSKESKCVHWRRNTWNYHKSHILWYTIEEKRFIIIILMPKMILCHCLCLCTKVEVRHKIRPDIFFYFLFDRWQ